MNFNMDQLGTNIHKRISEYSIIGFHISTKEACVEIKKIIEEEFEKNQQENRTEKEFVLDETV